MAKTRSQTGNIAIKKEEEKDCKDNLTLNDVSSTTKKRAKITERKSSKSNNTLLPAQQIKVEEDTDTKSLFQSSSKSSKLPKRQFISQEKINRLIDAIVNDNMSITEASRTAKISLSTARYYYNVYKSDPEKKIPLPRNRYLINKRFCTQKQVENFIRYAVDSKMSIKEASTKASMSYDSGKRYYKKYLEDPAHNIPIPHANRLHTQDQNNEFIGYIVNDKMSIKAASLKAKMTVGRGKAYYHKYFDVQNPDLAKPSHVVTFKRLAQEQIKELITYIVDDKMNVNAASMKANISASSAWKHYRRYLKGYNIVLPVRRISKPYTQDNINELIGYIIDDKMTVKAASEKANIYYNCAKKFYRRYLKDNNLEISFQPHVSQKQISDLISYIVEDKIGVSVASKKTNMCHASGYKYYRRYLKDQKRDVPT